MYFDIISVSSIWIKHHGEDVCECHRFPLILTCPLSSWISSVFLCVSQSELRLDVCSKLDSLNHQVAGQLHASDSGKIRLQTFSSRGGMQSAESVRCKVEAEVLTASFRICSSASLYPSLGLKLDRCWTEMAQCFGNILTWFTLLALCHSLHRNIIFHRCLWNPNNPLWCVICPLLRQRWAVTFVIVGASAPPVGSAPGLNTIITQRLNTVKMIQVEISCDVPCTRAALHA